MRPDLKEPRVGGLLEGTWKCRLECPGSRWHLFSTMSRTLQICAQLPKRSLAKGEDLIVENRDTKALYVLETGTLEILKQDIQVNVVSSPGSIFGEVSVLLDRLPMATVRALEDSTVYVVDDAAAFLERHPELNLQIARLLAHRLNSVTTYLVDLKQQFESNKDHLGMVDEVLESILHHQENQES